MAGIEAKVEECFPSQCKLRVQGLETKRGKVNLMRNPIKKRGFPRYLFWLNPFPSPLNQSFSSSDHHPQYWVHQACVPAFQPWYFHLFITQIILLPWVFISSSQCNRMHNCYASASMNYTKKVWWLYECPSYFLKCFALCGWKVFHEFKAFLPLIVQHSGQSGSFGNILPPSCQKKRLITLMAMRVN